MAFLKILAISGFLGIFAGASEARAGGTETCPNFEEKIRKCMALHGSEAQRSKNTVWRENHLPAMIQEEYGFTLIYLDESVEKPIAAQMTGIRLMRVLSEEQLIETANCTTDGHGTAQNPEETKAPTRNLWAEVRLPQQFQDLCGLSLAYVQVDDHLGAENQVVSVAPEGMLLKSGPGLFWISVQPADFFPEFRMVWQSSYRVAPTISHSGSSSKRKSSKKKKKRKKPKRKSAKKRKKR